MAKRVNIHPAERIDRPDFNAATSEYTQESTKQLRKSMLIDRGGRVGEGFRVAIADQGVNPRQISIYNGFAFDRDGQLLSNEDDEDATRSITLTADATYFIEVQFTENESDVDSRAFWDPTFANGSDPSGDERLPGKEFNQNISTRITPDWSIVQPVSTSGFSYLSDPDTTRIPIAVITVTGGVIVGGTTAAARTVLAEACGSGATTLRVMNSRHLPDAGTATVGGTNVTILSNDRESGVLSLTSAIGVAKAAGARVVVTTASAPQFLVERTTGAIPSSGTQDARPRLWQGDSERGAIVAQNPAVTTGTGDAQIVSLKDYVDFLAAQIREIKFGVQFDSEVNTLPLPSFSGAMHYSERSGGYASARTARLTIGNGTTSWGDFNLSAYGSHQACVEAAVAALPAGGGTIYIRPGVTFTPTASIVLPANCKVTFVADGYKGGEVTFELGLFQIVSQVSTSGYVRFANCHIRSTNTAASGELFRLDDGMSIEAIDCTFSATTTTGFEALINVRSTASTPGGAKFIRCEFIRTTTDDEGTLWFSCDTVPISNVLFDRCTFRATAQFAGATFYGILITEARRNIEFENCDFHSTGNTVANTIYAIHLDTTENSATPDNAIKRRIQNCTFNGGRDGTFVVGGNMVAISLRNISYVKVLDCEVYNALAAYRFLAASGSTNDNAHNSIDGLRVVNCGEFGEGSTIAINVATGVTMRRTTIRRLNLSGQSVSAAGMLVNGNGGLLYFTVEHSEFHNVNYQIQCLSLDAVWTQDCLFETTETYAGSDLKAPDYDQGTSSSASIDASGFIRNKILGYSELCLTSPDACVGFFQRCEISRAMEISDNQFYVAKNFTYTGSTDAAGGWVILNQYIDTSRNMNICRNQVHAFRAITQGGTGEIYYGTFWNSKAQAGGTSQGGDWSNTKCESNNLGLAGCRIQFMHWQRRRFLQLSISHNTIYRHTGAVYMSDFVINNYSSTSNNYGFKFHNNQIILGDETGNATWTNSSLDMTAEGRTILGLEISNNQWVVEGAGWSSAEGIDIVGGSGTTIHGLIIKANTCLVYDSPSATAGTFNIQLEDTGNTITGNEIPSVGNYFTDNYNLLRAS